MSGICWTSFTFQQVFHFHWSVMMSYLYQHVYYMLASQQMCPQVAPDITNPFQVGAVSALLFWPCRFFVPLARLWFFFFLCFRYKFTFIQGSFSHFSRQLYYVKMHPQTFQSLARQAGSHDDLETITVEGMGMLLASVLTASEVLNGDNETGMLPCFNAPEVGKIYNSLFLHVRGTGVCPGKETIIWHPWGSPTVHGGHSEQPCSG